MFDERTSTSPLPSISTTAPCGETSVLKRLYVPRLAQRVELGGDCAVELVARDRAQRATSATSAVSAPAGAAG